MKAAARAGMYCMPSLKELAEIDAKHPEMEERLRRVVRFFKNNPGMGVWKGADEPQWGKIPFQRWSARTKSSMTKTRITRSGSFRRRAARSRSCAIRSDLRHRRRRCFSGELSAWAFTWPRRTQTETFPSLAITRRKCCA